MRGDATIDLPPQEKPPAPEVLWTGAVVGQGRIGGGRVTRVVGGFPDLGEIDAAIDAGLNPPPADGALRETARRTELARRLSTAADIAGGITEQTVADWMQDIGADSVADYLERTRDATRPGGFGLTFESDAPGVDTPVRLDLSAVVFARGPDSPDFSLSELLRETRQAQARAAADDELPEPKLDLTRRQPIVAVWIVPQTWFDEQDWPGADRAARIAQAAEWLGPMGIALVPTALA